MLRTILASAVAFQALALGAAIASPPSNDSASDHPATHRSWQEGGWRLVETTNFRVCAIASEAEALSLAQSCETLRAFLCQKWLGSQCTELVSPWTPKCYVVVHPTATSYLAEVGPGQQTAGSSYIEMGDNAMGGNAVTTRRIDLRADHPHGYCDALAHEMTHVVIAARFVERQIPRWADEGMAVLADSALKQTAHLADLREAHSRGQSFRLAQLFAFENYPQPDQQATFYGQSVSLAKFLVERGSAEQLVGFVELATKQGYDTAARDVYQFDGVAALERAWLSQLASAQAMAAHGDASPPRSTPIIGRQVAMTSR
jgi:peptidase MA superfamily protein